MTTWNHVVSGAAIHLLGRNEMCSCKASHVCQSCQGQDERLRAVNAILLECLEGLFTIVGEALIEGDFDQSNKADIEAQHDLAREAIEEANK